MRHPSRRDLIVLLALSIVLLPAVGSAQSGCGDECRLDRAQQQVNYGYWFEQSVQRWETFTPGGTSICRLDLHLGYQGAPGNVEVEVADDQGVVLWTGTIAQAAVVNGWNTLQVSPSLAVVTGATYVLRVRSDAPSPEPANRYFWSGQIDAAYSGTSDVSNTRPGYAYTFRVYGGCTREAAGDFDGDRKSDLALFRGPAGTWWILESGAGHTTYAAEEWGAGAARDVPVPGDYDGDGKADYAFWRPSTGTWWVLLSGGSYSTYLARQWGSEAAGDIPVPADYDGDGRTDLAFWRPSTGTWWVLFSGADYTTYVAKAWGTQAAGDVPLPGDYDGDRKADFAFWRPSAGTWWVLESSAGYTTYAARQWGTAAAGDVPMPGDYDGDGKVDPAFWRPSSGTWWVLQSGANYTTYLAKQWGSQAAGDMPVPGDFDGDGRADPAFWRPLTGTWWALLSGSGHSTCLAKAWGVEAAGDVPALRRHDAPQPAQRLATITFGGAGSDGSTFGVYTESVFTVAATAGAWTVSTGYGHPAPFIQFLRAAGAGTVDGEVTITAGGSPFRFSAVDIYSSITPIPYVITGVREGAVVFTLQGTQPNTFGNFATITNGSSSQVVDRLIIRLSNPATPSCPMCSNPVGLDNIVLFY